LWRGRGAIKDNAIKTQKYLKTREGELAAQKPTSYCYLALRLSHHALK